MTLRILTDLHHSVLYESLAMLFVDRAILGDARITVWVDGHYVTEPGPQREEFGRVPMAVTPGKTLGPLAGTNMVISTVSGTREPLRAIAERCGALYVDHIGNAWDEPIGNVVLRAAYGKGEQGLVYHPEFHRVPWVAPKGDRIASFHASYPHLPCRSFWDEHAQPSWVMYGLAPHFLYPKDVARARAACKAIVHCKDADGYGFGIHEAFASGRAVIGHRRHYEGKIAESLFVPGLTYVEPEDYSPDLDWVGMGAQARARFDSLVDFDKEAEAIKEYLEARL